MSIFSLKPQAFGMDISDFSLKIAYLKKKEEIISLVSFGKEKIPPGIVKGGQIKDEDKLAEIIKRSLRNIKGEKIKTKYVVSSLPEEKSFLDVIQVPKLKKEEIESMIKFEIENHIPFQLEEVYFDFEEIEPSFGNIKYKEILITATPKDIVDAYVRTFKKAGLQPLALEIECSAIVRSLIKENKPKKPILIIDFGETRTTFIIYSGKSLRLTSTIPFSSQLLTEALARQLKISLNEAEKLKIKEGLEGSKKVAKILSAQLNKLMKEIKNHLDYYRSHEIKEQIMRDGRKMEKILLCGEGANLKGLTDFIESNLKITAELGNPWVNILKEPLKEIPGLTYKKSLGYTTALGLALRSL